MEILKIIVSHFLILCFFISWLIMIVSFYGIKDSPILYNRPQRRWEFWYGKKRVSNSMDVRIIYGKNQIIFLLRLIMFLFQIKINKIKFKNKTKNMII